MTSDNYVLIGLAVGGLLVVWLVFSLVKKLFGIVLLVALAVAGYLLWSNPELQRSALAWISGLVGS